MEVDYSKYFPMREYYEKVVLPLDKRFKPQKRGMYICCIHDDTDPSLGVINTKKGEVYHCFGCNAWGNILDLHKRVSLKYFNKRLDDVLCKRELCNIFNIDYNSLPREDDYNIEDVKDKNIRKELAMRDALSRFDISDFRNGFIEGKMEGKGVGYFNTLLIRMINEVKKEEE